MDIPAQEKGKSPFPPLSLSIHIYLLLLLPWVFIATLKLSLVEATKGYVLVVMHRLLTAAASPVTKHRLQDVQAQ